MRSSAVFLDVVLELLNRGDRVRFRADGKSMHPTIKEGEVITIVPVEPSDVTRGDLILYRAERGVIAHRVASIIRSNGSKGETVTFVLRGDASGTCDARVEPQQILGKVVSVERAGYSLALDSRKANMLRTIRVCASRLKGWIGRLQRSAIGGQPPGVNKQAAPVSRKGKADHPRLNALFFLMLAGLLLCLSRPVQAAQVTIDATVHTTATSHNGSTPTVVFISDQTGYAFYRDSTGSCVYSKTTDGGGSWGAAVMVDSPTDRIRIAVWYDRWTPGDTTGTNIHIVTMDGADLWYTRLNTSDDSLTTINATGTNQGGSFAVGANIHSMTKGTDGDLYMGVQDVSDSFVIKCASVADCTNASNWAEAGTNPFDLDEDWLILMPLSGGNIMAIRWDITADDIQSKVYTVATNTWDASWTTIDANAPDNTTHDAAFGATVDKTSGFIYLAYAADIGAIGGNDDDIRTAVYNGTSWTSKTDVLTNTTQGVIGVKIAIHENTGAVYVVYSARTTGAPSTGNIYWKKSTDGMATWGAEQGPVNTTSADIRGARVNIVSSDRIYVTWVDPGPNDLFGNTIEDVSPTAVTLMSFTATASDGEVLLQWHTGYEVDNLGFHIYRQEGGQRIRMTPSLVAGSALFAGAGTALTAGRSYAWRDVLPEGTGAVRYWLKDVALNGQRTWHGPVEGQRSAVIDQRSASALSQGALLSRLGRGGTRGQGSMDSGGEFVRSREGALDTELGVSRPKETHGRLEQQWALAAGPTVKLGVQQAGWYRAGQQELVAAGLDPQVDPRFLQLFVDGQEVPIAVTGTSDGRFDPEDVIEFYGVGLDTPWTDTHIYWLVAGARPGKRITTLPGQEPGGQAPASSPFTVEWKPRTLYFANLKNGEAENFFGPAITTEPVEQALRLQHLDPAPPGETLLEVVLQGVTAGPHQVTVWLNGVEVGVVSFAGQAQGLAQLPVSPGLLQAGENLLALVAEGGETDVSLVDVIRLTYWHTYAADDDALPFTAQGGERVTITGFTSPAIRVLDITHPQAVRLVVGAVKPQEGGFAITVTVPGRGSRTLWAFAEARAQPPAAITANQPSAWHERWEGGELVIIAHRTFLKSIEPLKAVRERQGWGVAIIDVEDLYDEFSYGAKSPWALRDFLVRASAHGQGPRFVLLVGDASFDPRNYLGLGDVDLVPTKLVDTAFLETASDDWFGDFDDDGLPELAVGRLPVRTREEAEAVVQKLVAYEQGSGARWEAVVVADENEGFDFEGASATVEGLLPEGMTVWEVFRSRADDDTTRRELLARLNAGPALVNYLGHGSVELWRGELLTSADARALTNGLRLPIVVSMTCLNGFFHDPSTESLAEALLKATEGGALAVWASSGLTGPGEQVVMNLALVRLLFQKEAMTLGEAMMGAKAAVGDRDIRRTWMLFGDPTTRLR